MLCVGGPTRNSHINKMSNRNTMVMTRLLGFCVSFALHFVCITWSQTCVNRHFSRPLLAFTFFSHSLYECQCMRVHAISFFHSFVHQSFHHESFTLHCHGKRWLHLLGTYAQHAVYFPKWMELATCTMAPMNERESLLFIYYKCKLLCLIKDFHFYSFRCFFVWSMHGFHHNSIPFHSRQMCMNLGSALNAPNHNNKIDHTIKTKN